MKKLTLTEVQTNELRRSRRHKTFHAISEYGKTSVGSFFGLKLRILNNDQGGLLAFKITRVNRSDSQEGVPLLKSFNGLAFGDKGYKYLKSC